MQQTTLFFAGNNHGYIIECFGIAAAAEDQQNGTNSFYVLTRLRVHSGVSQLFNCVIMGFNLDEAGNIFQMQKISRQWTL